MNTIIPHYYGYTGASTDCNLTYYELRTLNDEGFLEALPVFLDYIFNPLFDESIYRTEIHHVDENGHDGGVVCNEIRRKRFNTIDAYYEFLNNDTSHVKDYNGYFVDLETIKKVHEEYYRLDNCLIIIRGNIDHENVLDIIEAFEKTNQFQKFPTKFPNDPFTVTMLKNEVITVKTPFYGDNVTIKMMWRANNINVSVKIWCSLPHLEITHLY